jgi:aldose 1-epimerase
VTVLELASASLRLRLVPAIGASLLSLELRHRGAWVRVTRPAPEPLARSSDSACFLLVPYSNRIRDGRFSFDGKTYQLLHTEKHAIHGDVRDRAWRIVCHDAASVRLAFDSREHADVNFPFPFTAEVTYRLDGAVFVSTLRVTNSGSERMPAGLGFHPYFERALGGARELVELKLAVGGVYPGDTPLPTGPPVPLAAAQDFSRARPLDVALDHCFAGWDGHARLRWPVTGVLAELQASPALRHVIVYSPAGQPFFALEPVSNANDGFNLYAAGQRDTGVVALAKDEPLEGSFTLRFDDAD